MLFVLSDLLPDPAFIFIFFVVCVVVVVVILQFYSAHCGSCTGSQNNAVGFFASSDLRKELLSSS